MDLDGPSLINSDEEEIIKRWKGRYFYNKISVFFKNCIINASISKGNLFLEFSAPKVMYGSNVYMLYTQQIDEVLQTVKNHVEGYYNVARLLTLLGTLITGSKMAILTLKYKYYRI